MNKDLVQHIEANIFPLYDQVDPAHDIRHIQMVIENSLRIAKHYDVDEDMVYCIACYHDAGIRHGRENHEKTSAEVLRNDVALKRFFSDEQIRLMAEAVEDHRASSNHEPRSIYGRIVAEADRDIDPERIIRRSVDYALAHHPGASKEEIRSIALFHLEDKYGRQGYLKLYLHDERNEAGLETLRMMIETQEAASRVDQLLNINSAR